jgi:hypothetical protein
VSTARLERPGVALEIELPDAMALEASGDGVAASRPGARLDLTAVPAMAGAPVSTSRAVAAHLAHLPAARVIDVADAPLPAGAGTRVLLHHVGDAGATCLEEWRVVVGGLLVTLSAQCSAPAYDALADEHAAAAASLRRAP